MNVLIADDDPTYRLLLSRILQSTGRAPVTVADGEEAWQRIEQASEPLVAILDWTMPAPDGVELCRRIRRLSAGRHVYAILLTARTEREDVLEGLRSGADDYITKPCDPQELIARVQIAERMLGLQQSLADRVKELEVALARVRELQQLLPMCSYCKRVRRDQDYWEQVEQYMSAQVGATFSHGICPQCYESVIGPQLEAARKAAGHPPPQGPPR